VTLLELKTANLERNDGGFGRICRFSRRLIAANRLERQIVACQGHKTTGTTNFCCQFVAKALSDDEFFQTIHSHLSVVANLARDWAFFTPFPNLWRV
jgi:hypothetical protein